jgi:inosose dehydratase
MIQQRFRIGAHPINWVGEDVKEHGEHTTFERIVDDMLALGLLGTEMGRKYPTETEVLKQELEKRGMQLVSQWKSVLFSDPSYREAELESYRQHVLFLKEMGCKVISTCESGGSPQFDPRRAPGQSGVVRLDDAGWKSLAEGLHAAGAIAKEHGLTLTYHHHGGTVVEQPDEIDRLMEMTDPALVSLLYDTGHAYYGGADPLAVLQKHYERIAYVHLKDVRRSVLDQARKEQADFITCIRRGVFTLPGTGDLDFKPIVNVLLERGYSGWAMLEGEQDPAAHPPYKYAQKALTYLHEIINAKAGV